MRETPPSGYPNSSDETIPDDSDLPTQLWESPFKYLSEFPVRRAARRRERLEALLKGQDVTMTDVMSSTHVTRTSTASSTAAGNSVTEVAAQPRAAFEADGPPSIPTGTYTSVTPVNGPRLAVFVAVGVAVGGLAALQLNHFLTPVQSPMPASFAGLSPGQSEHLFPSSEPLSAVPITDSTKEVLVHGPAPGADVPPLPVDIVPLRPVVNSKQTRVAGGSDVSRSVAAALVSPEPAVDPQPPNEPADLACARFPSIQIPTQLHPRMNPLMTSSQVFQEQPNQRIERSSRH